MQGWLPLNEYSIKYRISLSTLRRRIRTNEIKFRFDEGKYWLYDSPIPKHLKVKITIPQNEAELSAQVVIPRTTKIETPEKQTFVSDQNETTQEMLKEIKGAFIKVLQEKEEQILMLKEEVGDLKTLVKMLEAENERLKANTREAAPIDAWLSNKDL